MSQEPNPKDFYNRSDYTPALAKGAPISRSDYLTKPDDASSPPPPPPYSPALSSAANPQQQPISTYGGLSTPDHQGYSMPSASSSPNRRNEPSTARSFDSAGAPSVKVSNAVASRDSNGNERSPLLGLFRDKKNRRTCFKKSLKFLLALVLLAVGAWKYIGFARPSPAPAPIPSPPEPAPSPPVPSPGVTCQGLPAVLWDVLPRQLTFDKEIHVRSSLGGSDGEGTPSTGKVIVHQTPEYRREGKMEVLVKVSMSLSLDALRYEFKDGQLTFQFPTIRNSSSECVELDLEIWVPERAKVLVVDVPSVPIHAVTPLTRMDLVDLQGSTVQIQEYEGKELRLSAKGNVEIVGTVETRDPVQVTSQVAGTVTINRTLMSKKSISLQSNDGKIEASGRLIADDNVFVRTTNGPVLLYDSIQAENVQVEAANGLLRIDSVGETASLTAKTSNGAIDIGSVRSEKDAKIQLMTSNGSVVAHMTHEYEGTLSIRTSEGNKADIVDQGENIDLQINEPYMKEGKRLDGDGLLTVSTSNGDAEVYFDA
ncbi:hypothetical protein BX666DRAFT_1875567 [Dichotomocladium elegans]|nr:hypothetical protein BX666DRAFT_1875567 [Dichotomocladium elegans]